MIPARATLWVIAATAALAIGAGIWWLINSRAQLLTENRALRDQIETGGRMEDAGADMRRRDDGGIIDWLRDRGQ